MYEEDEESGSSAALPHASQPSGSSHTQQIDEQSEATNVVSQMPEPDPQAYLGQIPQQYIEQSEATNVVSLGQIPQQYIEDNDAQNYVDTMPPQYMYGARGGIDYSKFGF